MTNEQLWKAREAEIPKGTANVTHVFAASARNATIIDVEGREYIDFAGGIGAMNVGHCHPRVVAAVQDQATKFSHTCFHVMPYEPYVTLAARLNRTVPIAGPVKTMFANSGAEAVENAVKIARNATRRNGIIAFEDAFHGRTLLAMTLTSKVMPYKSNFGPFAPEIYRLPYPYCYRCPLGLQAEDGACALECANLVEAAFKNYVGADEVAAVIIEPVLGEGGFVVPPPGYFPRLGEICDSHGILLVTDEVQSGFARTGRYFAIEHWGVSPDIITSAKSLAAGYPLSAISGRADVMDAPHPGGLGGTYGGNPTACRAALEVFDIIEHEGLLERATKVGARVMEAFREMQQEIEVIGDVRGIGAMVGMELVHDRLRKTPAADITKRLVDRTQEKGLIMISAGTHGNVIRPLMPVTIEYDLLERGLDILHEALVEVTRETGVAG